MIISVKSKESGPEVEKNWYTKRVPNTILFLKMEIRLLLDASLVRAERIQHKETAHNRKCFEGEGEVMEMKQLLTMVSGLFSYQQM